MEIGFTKKARVLWISFLLFCFSLFLTAYSARNPQITRLGSAVIQELVNPFQTAFHIVAHKVWSFWSDYSELISVREQNRNLATHIRDLEAQNAALLEAKAENVRLAKILELRERRKLGGLVAEVIGYDVSGWVQAITVNKGYGDGVRQGLAVVDGVGVVGQVVSVSTTSARILLITDHSSGVDALVQESRARGVIEGSGAGRTRLSHVLKEQKVELGDRVVASGMDGIYPKGMLVGQVSDVSEETRSLFRTIEVEPAVDFRHLESVFVITRVSQVVIEEDTQVSAEPSQEEGT